MLKREIIMANRFINDDVKPKVGGRNAVKIADFELENLMLNAAKKCRWKQDIESRIQLI
jgi:hypothetical protein